MKYTKLEFKVIEELIKVYDPLLLTDQEQYTEYQRIANSVGIEVEDVVSICYRWQGDKIREDMKEIGSRKNNDEEEIYT
jgi:hypothetical protein